MTYDIDIHPAYVHLYLPKGYRVGIELCQLQTLCGEPQEIRPETYGWVLRNDTFALVSDSVLQAADGVEQLLATVPADARHRFLGACLRFLRDYKLPIQTDDAVLWPIVRQESRQAA